MHHVGTIGSSFVDFILYGSVFEIYFFVLMFKPLFFKQLEAILHTNSLF
jgi:hypothetical protein